MTKGQLITECFRQLEEPEDNSVFFSLADITTALDDAYTEISDETEWNEKFVIIDLLLGRPYYDLRTLVPDHILSIGPAFNTTTNRWLIPTGAYDLDLNRRRWEQIDGEPDHFMVRGLWWLNYWPITNSASSVVKQYYTTLPEVLEVSENEPGFPAEFHWGLVEHVKWDLWPQKGEPQRGIAAWQEYLKYEMSVGQWAKNRGSHGQNRHFGVSGGRGIY
jgi:hypothetical protein